MLKQAVFAALFVASVGAAAPPSPLNLPPGARMVGELVYAERGEVSLRGDLTLPAGQGPFPVVLLVHGGGWTEGTKVAMLPVAAMLARQGHASFSITYRLAPQDRHPAPLEDCRKAVRWIRANAERYSLDASRIAGWGHSAGGHLVALLATTGNEPGGEPIAAAVVFAGPSDLAMLAAPGPGIPEVKKMVPQYLGASLSKAPDVYRAASPITHVDAGDPPFFLLHGTSDVVVPIAHSEVLAEALKRAGVSVELFRAEGTGHSVFMTPALLRGAFAAVAFLHRSFNASRAAGPGTPH